jgi:DivIVA domain-containing protein
MAISFSRPDPSSPAAVSAASFNSARRGFDQTEVRDFLRMVSAELARLQERERFLESELKAMQTRGMSGPGMLDEEVVTALLGEEAARVLGTAREASVQIRQRAEESATRLVKEASADAARLREEAELEAARRREDAAADAEAEIELAKQQGRDMVNEARDYREKVLTELARRRELAREQIEQLIHNRDRLLNAFERARLATDDVMTGLVSVDHDLPREYVNLAPTTGPVATITYEPIVHETFADEVESYDAGVAVVNVVDEADEVQLFDHAALIDEPVVENIEAILPEIVDEIVEVAVEATAVAEEIIVIAEPVVAEPVVAEPVVETKEAAAVEVAVVEEPKSNVVSLFSKERPRPESSSAVNSEHPSVEKQVDEPEAPRDLAVVKTTNDDTVGSLFARLREGSVDKVSAGKVVQPRVSEKPASKPNEASNKKSEAPKVDEKAHATTAVVVTPAHDAGAFERRAEVLAPLAIAMSRKLKRVLADEENEVLEYLRGKKNALTIDAMLGDTATHVQRYATAIEDDIMAAAKGGAKAAKAANVLPVIIEMMSAQLVQPLRDRLEKAMNQNSDDRTTLAKSLRGVYRQWKSQHIDEQIDDIAHLSYSRGMYVGMKSGTSVCWMVDPNGPECPDAEDNSLAGCVALGDEFPTSHVHPLAHAGCRCLLAPAQQ